MRGARLPVALATMCLVSVFFWTAPPAMAPISATATATAIDRVAGPSVFSGGTALAPTTPVTWGSPSKPGPDHTRNYGNALARTVRDGSQRLHVAYATNDIGGTWATDSGPYAGIYYTRSGTGATWTTPRRVTSPRRHVTAFGLAAAGSRVYLAYVTQTRIDEIDHSAPRVLYVRVNTNHGFGDDWKGSVRLTGTTGIVDRPTVAASGTDVHIAFTSSKTGAVIVATSRDRGVTWVKRTIGTTINNTNIGRSALPFVAVSGSTVAVTWIAQDEAALQTRVSTDRGSTWGDIEAHPGAVSFQFQTAVAGSRVGVVWTASAGVFTRIATDGIWGDVRLAAPAAYLAAYSPTMALQGASGVAISWAERTATPNYAALRYAESTNDGEAWYGAQTIASTTVSTRRSNDFPSIVWPSAGTRYVSWNGWTSGADHHRIYLRKGTGTPPGLVEAAANAERLASEAASVQERVREALPGG
jgi:hypothetical protein